MAKGWGRVRVWVWNPDPHETRTLGHGFTGFHGFKSVCGSHGVQPQRYDIDAACKPPRVITTPARRHASPAASPAVSPTRTASPTVSLRRNTTARKPHRVATTPTRRHASLAASLRHRCGLQAPPRHYDTNTAARKPPRVATTPTRRHASPTVSPRHRCGMQALPHRCDATQPARMPRRVATTPTWPACPAASLQHRRRAAR
ncbi:hypothetical protein EDB84DRAFT_1443736 [Lactarius hengduanensis]|nr:hypothetical protein EDB84DRAFT_1443736 [Lactarius hengduanensis]